MRIPANSPAPEAGAISRSSDGPNEIGLNAEPFSLTGSAAGWSMSYTPAGEPDAPGRALGAPKDPAEGLAFNLWNQGRKEEAIAYLERQIALEKDFGPGGPSGQRFRFPIKTSLAALMLLAAGGALWGGLNPSGADVPPREVLALEPPSQKVATQEVAAPAAAPEASEPEVAVAPRPDAIEQVASTEAEPTLPDAETPSAAGVAATESVATAPPPEDVGEEAAEAPTETEPPAVNPYASEPRTPKARPDYSTEEAMAYVQPARAAPVRRRRETVAAAPVERKAAPAPRYEQVERYPRPPEPYVYRVEPRMAPYGRYADPRWRPMPHYLAEQRAMAEWYIAQRRAQAERGGYPRRPVYFELYRYP